MNAPSLAARSGAVASRRGPPPSATMRPVVDASTTPMGRQATGTPDARSVRRNPGMSAGRSDAWLSLIRRTAAAPEAGTDWPSVSQRAELDATAPQAAPSTVGSGFAPVSYTHLRAHETVL